MTTGGYLPLLHQLDRWQADAKKRHPNVIPCRAGCAACCHGPFDISVADAAVLLDGVAALPEATRAEVLARAQGQVAMMVELAPGWRPPYDIADIGDDRFDAVSDALADEPCPMLDGAGRCLAYHHRPMVCRIMGLGMVVESGRVLENTCPIQADFPDYAALVPAPFALARWEEGEEREHAAAAMRVFATEGRASYETTVAGAIVASGGVAGRAITG